jgi:hypothetical protein
MTNSTSDSQLSRLPLAWEEQLKANPYRALGVACLIGVGAGIVFGSKILRTALATALVEIGRSYVVETAKAQ